MTAHDIHLPSGQPVDAARYGRHAADTLRTSNPKPGYVGKHRQPDPKPRNGAA